VARPDPDSLKRYSLRLFGQLQGAVTAAMVHLGDRLGLYRALAAAGEPITSTELAARTGLVERWVREWAYNQAAARLVEVVDHHGAERFWLSPEAAAVLADEDSPAFGLGWFHDLPGLVARVDRLEEAFRSGVGYDYDAHGAESVVGIERSFEPWYRHYLLPLVLPALDGMEERLSAGASVADVGCGAGLAACLIGGAFPAAQVHGYDISRLAVERAEQRRAELDLPNVHFHDTRDELLPGDHRFDLVTTFDCLHDMTRPDEMVHHLRTAVADDGTWLLVDMKARDTFGENAATNPMAALMYGTSVLSCLASSLSEAGGAGLGTLGLPEGRAREMAEAAGFTRFRRLAIDHPVNAFYEIRPSILGRSIAPSTRVESATTESHKVPTTPLLISQSP
jgi:2-polyprenyl-3-methyl-5-hydroxy-6-metoxy-1,4-benzoquinol methylase